MDKSEKQALEEVETATRQLDMWASALGMSKEDLKDCKLKAIQELAEEEAKCEKSCGCCCKGLGACHDELNQAIKDTSESSNAIQYLTMVVRALNAIQTPSAPVSIHLHLAK